MKNKIKNKQSSVTLVLSLLSAKFCGYNFLWFYHKFNFFFLLSKSSSKKFTLYIMLGSGQGCTVMIFILHVDDHEGITEFVL